mgnify:CR=1 FL=1
MNSKYIKIPKNLSHEKIEQLISEIYKADANVDIKIPLEIEYRGFGIFPGIFMLVFSWMRSKKGDLIISLKQEDSIKLKEFSESYFGYLLLTTLWKHCKILDEEYNNIKPLFLNHTSRMFQKIQFLEQLPNNEIMIPCYDHYSIEKGLSTWLYSSGSKFKETPSSLDFTISKILKKLTTIYKTKGARNLESKSIDSITKIIWELFKNTDEHARTDYLNEINLSPSSRVLYTKIQQSSKRNYINNSDHSALKKYYQDAIINEENNAFFLEISIFDSGPGLAKRYLGENWTDNVSIDEEVNTIKKCLIKGQTSIMSIEGKEKGYGLDEVLQLLSEKRGFMKIRSGRAALYRNLIELPYAKTGGIDQVELYDWLTQSKIEFSLLGHVEGTQITLVFPFNN